MKLKTAAPVMSGLLVSIICVQSAQAAIALDRTRAVYAGGSKSLSLNISNENKQLPYLAQGWIEDAAGQKVTSPLVVLPPVQRLEPGAKSQVKVQGLPAAKLLPQDRETLFYFNLREIPPRSDKPNTLQIALQTRIKMFYRPQALMTNTADAPWQEKITLSRQGDSYVVNNPTPYFVTLIEGKRSVNGAAVDQFKPVMISPKSKETLQASASALGDKPVLTYINDYGGRPQLQFNCSGSSCTASPVKER